MIRAAVGAGAVAALLLAADPAPRAAAAAPLSEPSRLAAIYDLILDARFDQAEAEAARACPPAPPVTCELLDATSHWWRIQMDPDQTALDADFSRRVDQVIADGEAWTAREPRRAEAWFYLGAAYGARVQWRVLRAERLAAARDGKRIKESLDRALALDPQLADARFGLGLYKYYADIAPTFAKVLRFLLLLPGGNRAEGLADMIAARDRGVLVRGESEYQLHWIYFWYEQQPAKGLALLEQLHGRYPGNPLFAQRIAEVEVDYFHDPTASLRTWQALADAAQAGRVNQAALALARARLGAAEQLDALSETDRALEQVAAVIAARPSAPFAALARAELLAGTFHDRLGRRAEAVAAYRAALVALPLADASDLAPRARAGLRREPDATAAEAYRLSLEGWRALERGALDDAERALDRSLRLAPADAVAHYRRGRVWLARHDPARALAAFDRAIAARPAVPPVFLALSFLERGRVLEARRDEAGALAAYRAASRVFGADRRTRDAAEQAITRLQLTVPPLPEPRRPL